MRHRSTSRALYELLSSMRFAISLLTILGIASIIGTVLKQNEPYNNYLNQFGPFWFPVFEKLELYSVYNSVWFLTILGFLVLSTSACIVRQTRPMLRDMRSFRESARESSLAQFQHHARLGTSLDADAARQATETYLAGAGFQVRANPRDDGLLLAAKQGSWTRIGYFLAHAAIVLICLGGLLDGNLPLKAQMALGGKVVTSGNQLISDIKPESRLGLDNWSFRGNVFIPEGKSANVAVLNVQDGILLQDLPFTVSLHKFHLEHYDTGMPKRFASDILITDNATGKSVEKTIEVNKPFEFDGIMMYQASFEDGGSRLKLLGHDLRPTGPAVRSRMQDTTAKTLELFAVGGFESVGKFIESTIPEAEREKAADVFIKILEGAGWEAWKLARATAGQPPLEMNGVRARLLRDTLNATSDSLHYGAPVYLQLAGFDEVRATVLQVTRSPGKPIVYLGSLLLVLGVFAMLYIRERRLFVLIKASGETLVALSSNRKSLDVDESFRQHRDALAALLNPNAGPSARP